MFICDFCIYVTMSRNDEVKIENKTVRIPATAYYKAVEITGMLSAIAGHNFSLSEIIVEIITTSHTAWIPQLIETMQDEKKRAIMRAKLQDNVKFREGLDKTLKIRK